MVDIEGLEAGYGATKILFGVNISAQAGEVVALLGRNDMGKTTTISTVMGILRPTAGQVRFDGARLDGLPRFGSHATAWVWCRRDGRCFPI